MTIHAGAKMASLEITVSQGSTSATEIPARILQRVRTEKATTYVIVLLGLLVKIVTQSLTGVLAIPVKMEQGVLKMDHPSSALALADGLERFVMFAKSLAR